jgi:hypothetical protein
MPDDADLRLALRVVAKVLRQGAETHSLGAWRKRSARRHAAHSAVHLEKYLLGAKSKDDDLANAATRALMALQLREEAKETRTNG